MYTPCTLPVLDIFLDYTYFVINWDVTGNAKDYFVKQIPLGT